MPPDPSPIGIKYDTGKRKWRLLPWKALEEVVKVLEFGATKYSENNWIAVQNWRQRYFDAAQRHLIAWYEGEQNDSDSRLNHLAHAACCTLFLLYLDLTNTKIS